MHHLTACLTCEKFYKIPDLDEKVIFNVIFKTNIQTFDISHLSPVQKLNNFGYTRDTDPKEYLVNCERDILIANRKSFNVEFMTHLEESELPCIKAMYLMHQNMSDSALNFLSIRDQITAKLSFENLKLEYIPISAGGRFDGLKFSVIHRVQFSCWKNERYRQIYIAIFNLNLDSANSALLEAISHK